VISLLKADERSNLENKIESLRNEMILIGIQEGLTSEKTIMISQKLDIYIAKFQKINNR
jgi:hypothetical protein